MPKHALPKCAFLIPFAALSLCRRTASLLLLMAFACALQAQPGVPFKYVPGRVLVQFRPGVSDAQANGVLASLAAHSTGQIPHIGVHIVELPPAANEAAVVKAFAARSEVAFAELDRLVPPSDLTPNDP